MIESGLDIPQANTLCAFERADLLGLAQPHRISGGRVGRSRCRPRPPLLSAVARIDARGAGAASRRWRTTPSRRRASSRCPTSRSAARASCSAPNSRDTSPPSVSELYVELLAEAVAELTGGGGLAARPVRVDGGSKVRARPPSPGRGVKIDLHRRIALAETEDELRGFVHATEDRYGPMPGAGREPVLHPGGEAQARALGADYLVFRDGRVTVGPLVLGSQELGDLPRLETAGPQPRGQSRRPSAGCSREPLGRHQALVEVGTEPSEGGVPPQVEVW